MTTMWRTRPDLPDTDSMVGYEVEGLDGRIGTIDEATWRTDRACLVVDVGPRILGRQVLVPAGLVDDIDHPNHTVHVVLPRDVVKDSPVYDPELHATGDPAFWQTYETHYRAHDGGLPA